MLMGRPILAGDSDANQLKLIFELVGTPNEKNMPGWKSLPGAQGLDIRPIPSRLAVQFRE
jgi:serine/threonine-protein kinase BUR1